jgi:FkbM family methyltransferase
MRIPAVVRSWIDPLTERIPLPVVAGANRGRWWSVVSSGSGYVSGRRAHEQMAVLQHLISPGDIVWDVGAHHGYVTLLAAAQVRPNGWVCAFEPGGRNLRILKRHVRWNRLGNVSVHDCALASYTGTARFGGGDTSKMHALGSGDEEVSACTGEMLVRSAVVRAPTFVKIDVEGAEADVLAGALPIVPSRAVILMAIHSASADQACTRLLRANGFELIPSGALDRARRLGWRGDPDLLCIGPDHEDGGRIERLLQSGCFQRA